MRSATTLGTFTPYFKSISTHALHAERDGFKIDVNYHFDDFNSHAPWGARLAVYGDLQIRQYISTHALRVERDPKHNIF